MDCHHPQGPANRRPITIKEGAVASASTPRLTLTRLVTTLARGRAAEASNQTARAEQSARLGLYIERPMTKGKRIRSRLTDLGDYIRS